MNKLRYTVKRGRAIGTVLKPHKYQDGLYRVSLSRFKKDYITVEEKDLPNWVKKGYGVRMSNSDVDEHRSPSLIFPKYMEFYEG